MDREATLRREVGASSNSDLRSTFWTKLWKISAPSKVKLFGWKACSDIVPTRVNLRRRNILGETYCPRCNMENEDSMHAFFVCPRGNMENEDTVGA